MNLKIGTTPRLVLGGVPRVDLLPPEVRQAAKSRSLHRGLVMLVVALMVVVGAGYGLATFAAGHSQRELDAANARTQSLLREQAKYVEVGKVTSELKLRTAARQVGSSTEIDWKQYVASVQASLPAGATITTFAATSGSPLAGFAQPTVPLQGARIAELTFSATSASLPDLQVWLDGLAKLTGFVDAAPGTVTRAEDGSYKAGVIMHINADALWNRFSAKKSEAHGADSTVVDTGKKAGE
jgi:hypothetical protein